MEVIQYVMFTYFSNSLLTKPVETKLPSLDMPYSS